MWWMWHRFLPTVAASSSAPPPLPSPPIARWSVEGSREKEKRATMPYSPSPSLFAQCTEKNPSGTHGRREVKEEKHFLHTQRRGGGGGLPLPQKASKGYLLLPASAKEKGKKKKPPPQRLFFRDRMLCIRFSAFL